MGIWPTTRPTWFKLGCDSVRGGLEESSSVARVVVLVGFGLNVLFSGPLGLVMFGRNLLGCTRQGNAYCKLASTLLIFFLRLSYSEIGLI